MLKMQKMIRMSHVVACPVVFILFYMIVVGRKECSR